MNAGSAGHEGDPAGLLSTRGVGLLHAGAAMSRPVKRSFTISGHRTSISLETAFWEALKSIATQQQVSVAALIARIDKARGRAGLSSAVRVWILRHYRELAERSRD
jgi:predicted DNA-binding ribbon-helix-helix protein